MERGSDGDNRGDETGYSTTAKLLLAFSLGLLLVATFIGKAWRLFN